MAATGIRKNILEIVNEARKKFALNTISSLTADKEAILMVDLLNDVIDEVSDYGDWKEMIREAVVTASSSVVDYSIETSALVKNIHEIAFADDTSPMSLETLDDILRLNRNSGVGEPRQWCVIGVDSNANPKIRVYPRPGPNQNNETFKVTFYQKPPLYTTADVSAVPEFPSRVLVAGLMARKCLEESGGTPTQQYASYQASFQNMLRDAYNRFNGDSGSDVFFRPVYSSRR